MTCEVPGHLADQLYCIDEAVSRPSWLLLPADTGSCAVVKFIVNKTEPEFLKPAVPMG
jgi:hypothetical protein